MCSWPTSIATAPATPIAFTGRYEQTKVVARPGGGTHASKMQWGATSAVLPWYYVPGRAPVPPSAAESSRAAAFVQSAWKRMPLPLTRILGPRLARRVPL